MPAYFLEFCFKGTNYSGWQIQENAVAVQQKINEALSVILGVPTETQGCGRTDTGVHAKQFFAGFKSDTKISDTAKLAHRMNGFLPHDISVFNVHPVADDASARFDAVARTYEYYLYRKKNAFLKEFGGTMFYDVNIEKINGACKILLEYDDFKCFSKINTDVKHTLCYIKEAKWEGENGLHKFTITANRFLRGMVRTIVGTLQKVGREEITENDFRKIIENKERSNAGPAADACGLYLTRIQYPYLASEIKFNFPFDIP